MPRIRRPNSTASRPSARPTPGASAPPALSSAHASAPSTTSAYSGICAAAVISDGLVVASRGVNFLIELRSPVSHTATVIEFSCSSRDWAITRLPFWFGRISGAAEDNTVLVGCRLRRESVAHGDGDGDGDG